MEETRLDNYDTGSAANAAADDVRHGDGEFSLYTEKIVVSPLVRYKKLLTVVRSVMIAAVVLILLCVAGIFANKYIISNDSSETAVRNPLILEKDEYDINGKSPALEGEEPDLSGRYYWIQFVKSVISKSVVQVGDNTAGIVVGEVDGDYIIITEYNSDWSRDDYYIKVDEEATVATTLLNVDNDTGMALIAANKSEMDANIDNLAVIIMGNSYEVHQNEIVIAIGRVQDNSEGYATGYITQITSDSGIDMLLDVLETNVELKAGDYAFVFDMNSELIGIANRKNEIYNEDSEHIIGISSLKPLIEKMSTAAPVAYLGVRSTNITKDVAEKFHFPDGIYVTGVELDSPAYKAGIQAGDIVSEINGETVATVQDLCDKVLAAAKGDTFKIKIMRTGKDGEYREIEYSMKLSSR